MHAIIPPQRRLLKHVSRVCGNALCCQLKIVRDYSRPRVILIRAEVAYPKAMNITTDSETLVQEDPPGYLRTKHSTPSEPGVLRIACKLAVLTSRLLTLYLPTRLLVTRLAPR